MENKNLYFISSMIFLILFAVLFFFIGDRLLKSKKAKIIVLIIIGVAQVSLIQFIWIKGYNLMWLEKGIVSGLSGCIIGLAGSGMNNNKKRL